MFVFNDYLMDGKGHGPVGEILANCRFEKGLLRPYFDSRRQRCVTVTNGQGKPEKRTIAELTGQGIWSPVFNATTLRKDEWIQYDNAVVKAARQRMRAWADLAAANSYGGFNGMAKTILERENISDVGEAMVDMDGLTEGRGDRPEFQLEGLPLPITHCDFFISSRDLMVSRNSGTPLSTLMAEMAARRVAEVIEQTTIGIQTGLAFGGTGGYSDGRAYSRASQVYGYTNFPDRLTKLDLTVPDGTNPEDVLEDVLEMRQTLYDNRFYGPFMLYHSTNYDRFLDNDYTRLVAAGNSVGGNMTLRDRIRAIDGISDVRRLDFLVPVDAAADYTLILVQMTSDVARAVNGMDITTVQWESVGGMRLNFKVMGIQVPQLWSDFEGRTGLLHGTTP
jgi:hypothetical protein